MVQTDCVSLGFVQETRLHSRSNSCFAGCRDGKGAVEESRSSRSWRLWLYDLLSRSSSTPCTVCDTVSADALPNPLQRSLERLKEPVLSQATCAELFAFADSIGGNGSEVREVQRKISTVLAEGASRSPPSRSPLASPTAASPTTSPKAASPAASPPLSPRSHTESDPPGKALLPPAVSSAPVAAVPVLVPAKLKTAASASKTPLLLNSREMEQLQHIVSSLPPPVYLYLLFLVRFFSRVCRFAEVNRTSVKKLCRLFGVLILHGNSQDSTRLVKEAFEAPVALRLLIENYPVLFAEPKSMS